MKATILAIALVFAPPAQADIFTDAFLKASFEPNPRVLAVVGAMQNYTPLQAMVRDGRIASPYDCLPEHRVVCAEALSAPSEETVIQEWGEWVDAFSPAELPGFVSDRMQEAALVGFNLFTDAELNHAEGYE